MNFEIDIETELVYVILCTVLEEKPSIYIPPGENPLLCKHSVWLLISMVLNSRKAVTNAVQTL